MKNEPTTVTFDTSVDLITISEEEEKSSDEKEEILDLASFWERPIFNFE